MEDTHSGDELLYCLILAGTNGSGKTTIANIIDIPGEFINADQIEAALRKKAIPNASSFSAGKMAIHLIDKKIRSKKPFTYETTLSSQQSVRVIQKAKASGFDVGLIFVCVNSPLLNVKRVKSRVQQGGHDIPIEAIIRRYAKSLANLANVLSVVDSARIYDNTGNQIQLLAHLKEGCIIFTDFRAGDELHQHIKGMLATYPASSPIRAAQRNLDVSTRLTITNLRTYIVRWA